MTEKDATPEEEHAEPDVQQNAKAPLKTFEVYFVLTRPGVAIVRARDSTEATKKLYQGDVEKYYGDAYVSYREVEDVLEVRE